MNSLCDWRGHSLKTQIQRVIWTVSSENTVQFIEDSKLVETWYNPTQILSVPKTHDQHYFKGIGPYKIVYNIYTGRPGNKTHEFRKLLDKKTNHIKVKGR